MARRIFVSYKYSDSNVPQTSKSSIVAPTTVRTYVDSLQQVLSLDDHINMGEADGESLANFKDDTIASRLRDKIFYSSTTIVLASRGMKEPYTADADQWIPWEVAYSLKNTTRGGRTSGTNSMVLAVLPDRDGSYDYLWEDRTCAACNSYTIHTYRMFRILSANMFNRRAPQFASCSNHAAGTGPQPHGDHSYIYPVKWHDLISNVNVHLDAAWKLRERVDEFNLVREP